jgi:predicted DNA-binding transcriptional regulator AlpA
MVRVIEGLGEMKRLLTRPAAAEYLSISASHFDDLVSQGVFPKPIKLGRAVRWDIRALDQSVDRMAGCVATKTVSDIFREAADAQRAKGRAKAK